MHTMHTCIPGTLRDLHDCGLVLRDIKPPNILIGAYDKPVFSDFGISEIVRTMTRIQQTSIKGTFNYMPPEAFQVGAVFTSHRYLGASMRHH